jgi:hypothetical protein
MAGGFGADLLAGVVGCAVVGVGFRLGGPSGAGRGPAHECVAFFAEVTAVHAVGGTVLSDS